MLDKVREALEYYEQEGNYREGDLATEALTELNTFIESNGWQDIKSAPKDGTMVILYFVPNEVNRPDKTKIAIGNYQSRQFKNCGTGELSKEFFVWHSNENFGGMSYAPTHWQPLPSIKSIKDM